MKTLFLIYFLTALLYNPSGVRYKSDCQLNFNTVNLIFSEFSIMFGYNVHDPCWLTNHLITVGKQYLYNANYDEKLPVFNAYKGTLQNRFC